MAREKISEMKYKGNGSPFNDYVESHGGIDAFESSLDSESLRRWQAEQAIDDSDEQIQLEAILYAFNHGGLAELTDMQRKVFQLCVVEELTHEAVAQRLKCARETVTIHLSRACKTLEEIAEKRVKEATSKNTKWTKEMIREVAQKFKKK